MAMPVIKTWPRRTTNRTGMRCCKLSRPIRSSSRSTSALGVASSTFLLLALPRRLRVVLLLMHPRVRHDLRIAIVNDMNK
eukprot:1861208-Rhodomonas_salina.7